MASIWPSWNWKQLLRFLICKYARFNPALVRIECEIWRLLFHVYLRRKKLLWVFRTFLRVPFVYLVNEDSISLSAFNGFLKRIFSLSASDGYLERPLTVDQLHWEVNWPCWLHFAWLPHFHQQWSLVFWNNSILFNYDLEECLKNSPVFLLWQVGQKGDTIVTGVLLAMIPFDISDLEGAL